MKAKRFEKDGKVIWLCGCGSKLQASYNIRSIRDCPDEDRVCAWCFKKSKKPSCITEKLEDKNAN